MYLQGSKRLFDLCIAVPLFIATLPLFLLVAAAVRFNLGPPVVFRQARPGLHARLFALLKFRSMKDDVSAAGVPLQDSERLTEFGRALRRTSLDEIPALINVIRGDMSLVGPRPLLAKYLPLYNADQRRRHDVRPGITGWAQVNGRNALTWERKFELDLWYIDNLSFALDLKILWITAVRVLRGSDVSAPGHDTAPEFTGTSGSPES